MGKISDVNENIIAQLDTEIDKGIYKKYEYLEEAAQKFTSIVYEHFKESIILCRLFITVPFDRLPEKNKNFVNNLANSAGITGKIKTDTFILSLAGTSGKKQDWNDRYKSKGHVGIPLASSDFISAVPMMSRLLKELGLGLDWIDSNDTEIVKKTMGKIGGVFYVPNAATAIDSKGRNIIAAQDFVKNEGVKTVFGIGGGYTTSNTFLTVIIFLNETIQKDQAEIFMRLINTFKKGTTDVLMKKNIFLD